MGPNPLEVLRSHGKLAEDGREQTGRMRSAEREVFVESVLRVVEAIPPGRVMAYGEVAAHVGRGGARQVGRVMAQYGGLVPWWRVVRADGSLPDSHGAIARKHYVAEGTPVVVGADPVRINMAAASWRPGGDDLRGRTGSQC